MTRALIATIAIALIGAATLSAQADPKAAALRDLLKKHGGKVVVLSWSTRTNAMGQNLDSTSSTCAVLCGERGLFVASNQPFATNVSGMANMFGGGGGGRGGSSGPTNFRVRTQSGIEFDAVQALEHKDENLRYFGAKLEDGMELGGVSFPERVEVPALGEEVVIIGAHDATLNYARFFRLARLNAIIEDGKYYGLDGSVQDCLGALVMTLDGKLLGIVGQKAAPVGQSQDPTGFGRMLGGISDPAKMLGNRVLMTPAAFAAGQKEAQAKVKDPEFGKGEPGADQPAQPSQPNPPARAAGFESQVVSARRREATKDIWVVIDCKGKEPPAKGSDVAVLDAEGKEVCRVKISEHYKDMVDPEGGIDQVAGAVADPDGKFKIEKGFKVRTPAPVNRNFRGIDRFMKVGEDVLGDQYAGAKVGFLVSTNPAKDSPARTAGLKSGDVIIKVGATDIKADHTMDDFWNLLNGASGEVTLTIVRRGGEKVEVKVAAN
ncbi:MAG: PDZ domain-containing protein [Planctomycetes bacterium]|nr:PDZ domain-containing protein [Planctomycetota bacterium]